MNDNDNTNLNGVAATLPDAAAKNQEQWREFCSALLAENERLRSEVLMLRDQRRQLLDTFVPGRHKQYDIDDEKFFAQIETEPTIADILAQHARSKGI